MKKFKRIFVIVADSMGIGNAPDAEKYTDLGANTFGHIAEHATVFNVPTLEKLGIGNICKNNIVKPVNNPMGVVASMEEISVGKDTLTGHFEIMGLKVTKPYPSFTETGFPEALLNKIRAFSGREIIGNISATSAVIAGAVKGDIDVNGPVVVDASAVVVGNIKSRSVQINSGAVIEGTFSQCYNDDVDVKGIFDEE